jgi:hypothetical protein
MTSWLVTAEILHVIFTFILKTFPSFFFSLLRHQKFSEFEAENKVQISRQNYVQVGKMGRETTPCRPTHPTYDVPS